ncbi:macrolide transport system ATP-binding/permease protein [Frondihabitans sp. PhB188]|uniref:ABC transporter ATP-binding protein/permease n=1 Tax=Frondihabitans sp. PhB188 TaxID=2485200 RepID=UPI000F49083A|nr:ABC transporter ATP-binding protein/permease [Frondihabitans sp. PhB188]ROQ39685.1 macrolide transport system ATP-binding/permease protein [Frondihabitans sp. PhB188]
MTPLIRLTGIARTFRGAVETRALREVALEVEAGELLVIVGPSGGGKSTLLNVIGLLDRPDEGQYVLDGVDVAASSTRALAEARSSTFGFVFQGFHLLDDRPVVDSVELGLLYRCLSRDDRRCRALAALDHVGMAEFASQKASLLSGGQRQRVAIARALSATPPVIVADEPTGNLDSDNGEKVVQALLELRDRGHTVVIVTHDASLASIADRVAHLRDGRIERIERLRTAAPAPTDELQVPGLPSRIRVLDVVRDGLAGVVSKRGRTAGLAGAVAVAVAMAVGTIGLSHSAGAQVSDRFDLHANRDVAVSWDAPRTEEQGASVPRPGRAATADLLDTAASLAGVDSVGLLSHRGSARFRTGDTRPLLQAPVASMTAGVEEAARLRIRWAPQHAEVLAPDEVLLGRSLARQVALGPLAAGPWVSIGDADATVVGIVEGSPRLPDLLGSVVTAFDPALPVEHPSRTIALFRTASGAAPQVARQAPLTIDPAAPQTLTVDAPADPRTLRGEIEGDVQSTLLALTGVSLAAAIVGLGNSMALAVLERRREFGLRRAVGARPVHISALVLCESSLIGAIGGVVGLFLGLAAVLTITVARQWIPVFDLLLAPAAIIGGIVVGALGGTVAAVRASRIQPQEALRL